MFIGGSACTIPVGADSAGVEPPLFVAVTRTRVVVPTSLKVSVYVDEVAPLIELHATPVVSQRSYR